MLISDAIEQLIVSLLEAGDGTLEIGRNELAARVGCVPSQINYVITSRFTAEKGYVIESRRGGGGYVRITRKDVADDAYLMHMFASIGTALDEGSARALCTALGERGLMDAGQVRSAGASMSAGALAQAPTEYKNRIRADIFRQILMSLMK